MSQSIRLPRSVRATGAAVGVLVFAGGVGVPAQAAPVLSGASSTLDYQCMVPIVGDQPVIGELRTNIPSYWTATVLSPAFDVQLDARMQGDTFLAMQVVGATPGGSLLGKGKAGTALAGGAVLQGRFVYPTPAGTVKTVPISVPLSVPQAALPEVDPLPEGLPLSASGQTPKVTFPAPGTAQLMVDSLGMSLQVRDASGAPIEGIGDPTDSDGDPLTFDVPCTGQTRKVAEITVASVGTPTGTPVPTTPPPPTPTPTPLPPTPTPIVGTPTPPPRTPTPTPYFGTPTPDVPTPTPTPLPPTPTPTPTPYFGTPTPDPRTPTPLPPTPTPTPIVGTPVPPTPLPPTPTPLPPTPTPHPDPVFSMRYALAGKAYLKTLASGSVAISGTTTAQNAMVLPGGATSGATVLNPATAKLNALRLLPITASLTFTEVGPTRGQWSQGGLSLSTSQVIRLRNAKVFGINLVTSTCVTSAPAVIPLKSPADGFSFFSGGSLSGTFTIPSFKSCGALTSLVTGLAAGSGNGISLRATALG